MNLLFKSFAFRCHHLLKITLLLIILQLLFFYLLHSQKRSSSKSISRYGKYDPDIMYEITRKRIRTGVIELWTFINHEIQELGNKTGDKSESTERILRLVGEHKKSLLFDIDYLEEVDGYAKWREKEGKSLQGIVQARLKYLQNPPDCNQAKKLVCQLDKNCGFGCQIHHLVYCLMVAYGTKRTLILDSKDWRYNKNGWEAVFKPISNTCTDPNGKSVQNWPATESTQVINLNIVDIETPKPKFVPPELPKDLALRIARFHGEPVAWWTGQFLKYIFKPQPEIEKMYDEARKTMNFVKPVVGIHIRRSDKLIIEAINHQLEEYMSPVEEYYDILERKQKNFTRRVYIATDDPTVFSEAQKKYPNYVFLGDPKIAESANVETRFSYESLKGILLDVYFLSDCDYLVGTFSSQLGRLVYEIMQTKFLDASVHAVTIDDCYYFGGQNNHYHVVVIPHKAENPKEIDLEVGDYVKIFIRKFWDGYTSMTNMRTKKIGLAPTFKIRDTVMVTEYPTYSEVTIEDNN